MRTYESICYNQKEYKGRRLDIPGWGNYLVASTILESKIVDSNYEFVSKEAENVDEEIFFYIHPSDYKKTDSILALTILKSL